MDMITPFAPNPGDAQPGNLYADLGTRTLWLGVEAAVDPAQAVLISDIVGMQGEIDQTLLDAKAYTDTRILTRAPTVHTHTASQITDFTAAVTAVASAIPGLSYIRGMVIMYSGSLAEIGVGGLAGWSLCDGSNGTPDLRERFVLAAGSRAIGTKNAATSFDTTSGGGHDHTVNGTAISIAQMPGHDHTPGTGGESVDHQHYVNINSGTESAAHNHAQFGPWRPAAGLSHDAGNEGDAGVHESSQTATTGTENQNHYHNVQGWSGGRNQGHTHAIYGQGGGQAHTHTLVGGGGVHQHNITASQLRETLPFYALAFIMKL